jgi:small redox-active disulfide protein 2
MIIKILGTGCQKCRQLEENTKKAVQSAGIEANIEKVTEIEKIMNYGVMMTPALVVDEIVKSAGKVLSPDEIRKFITK